ncbi:hypothetical protein [Massilia sp. SYSU DXS3249]
MKRTWPAFFYFLLLLLILLFLGFGAYASHSLPMQLATAAMALGFLVAFIHFTRPEDRIAGKLAGVLNVAAGGLLLAALVVWLLHTFAAVG